MLKRIKSEWYRINHTKPSLRVVILALLFCVLISFLGGEMPGFTRSSVSQTSAIAMYLCSTMLAVSIGISYKKRTAFYEIMDGNPADKIIFSKLAVYTSLAFICFFIPVSAMLLIFDGGVETVKYVALFFIVFMRILLSTLLLPMIFKSEESAALVIFPVVAETMLLSYAQTAENSKNMLFSILEWLPTGQMFDLGISINAELSAKVIFGFVIQVGVLYVLAHMSFKKKWMINTTIM